MLIRFTVFDLDVKFLCHFYLSTFVVGKVLVVPVVDQIILITPKPPLLVAPPPPYSPPLWFWLSGEFDVLYLEAFTPVPPPLSSVKKPVPLYLSPPFPPPEPPSPLIFVRSVLFCPAAESPVPPAPVGPVP